uniref:Short-chain dehydrogenase/reductase SDR n=1 Tax=mine drainage metagenome TaxID=410659 RepID=E6QK06_9ZZZZ
MNNDGPTRSDDLAGKVALVTGGAKRLGREIALTLARSGAAVAITYLESKREAETTVAECAKLGVDAVALPLDVRSETSVAAAVSDVLARFSRLDFLVNNAAVFEQAELADLSIEQWDRMHETNVRGPFLVARAALPHLRLSCGRIVNIGSLGGSHAWAGHAHYCASKAALEMLTKTMARAFAPEVSVNCVAPGWIAMPDLIDGQDEVARRFAARTPMGRNGSARDVAEAVRFFLTGPAFITGQILGVDGGLGLV